MEKKNCKKCGKVLPRYKDLKSKGLLRKRGGVKNRFLGQGYINI